MAISKEELLLLSLKGFVAFEGEEEGEFLSRISFAKDLKSHLDKIGPFEETQEAVEVKKEACRRAYSWAMIDPKWVVIVLSSYKLPFWQQGVAWIFQLTETSPISAFVQLRSLKSVGRGIFSYDPEEIIVHEFAHIARMGFQEKKYEEIIAYDSASSWFRRFWGPLFRTSLESSLFLFLLVTLFIWDLFLIYSSSAALIEAFLFLKLIPLVYLLFLAARLFVYQKRFLSALRHLIPICKDEAHARGVRLRLTDREIDDFSRMDSGEIARWLHSNQSKSLRLRQLWAFYE